MGQLFDSYINIDELCIIKDDEIFIPKNIWYELNQSYSKDVIKEKIIRAIIDNDLPMPMRDISLVDALESFNAMERNEQNPSVDQWFTRYDYKYPKIDLLFQADNTGNAASDFFHQESRWHCDSVNAPSPYRTWTTEKFLNTGLNALWSLKVERVDSATLRSVIGLRKYIASQFRPSTAKQIYNYFGASQVLDLSAGWGDRLAGFLASDAATYTGIDPNTRLHAGYKKEVQLYNRTNKTVTLIDGCAEDVDLGNAMFDFVFTSPPYFNVERYSQNESQSWKRYKKIDQWLEGFLFPALENAWNHLRAGGHMAINISDVYSGHRVNAICDPMNDFIASLGGDYIGCAGYEMRKRPNSGALKDKVGKFAEPIWIWQKPLIV